MIVRVQRGSALDRPDPVGSASLAELFSQPRYAGLDSVNGGCRGESKKNTINT